MSLACIVCSPRTYYNDLEQHRRELPKHRCERPILAIDLREYKSVVCAHPINTSPSQAEGIAQFACRVKYAGLTAGRRELLKVRTARPTRRASPGPRGPLGVPSGTRTRDLTSRMR